MSSKRIHRHAKRLHDHRLRWRKSGPHKVRKVVKTTTGRSTAA